MLRFTPYAWAKLLYLRDIGPTEVGGYGIAAADNLLLVEDFALVKQKSTACSVEFDPEGISDHFDTYTDLGMQPKQYSRIWIHTHPNISAHPSIVDEACFADTFSRMDWAVMFILSRNEDVYARMRVAVDSPASQFEVPVELGWGREFRGTDRAAWRAEYNAKVTLLQWTAPVASVAPGRSLPYKGGKPEPTIEVYGPYGQGWGDYDEYEARLEQSVDELLAEDQSGISPLHSDADELEYYKKKGLIDGWGNKRGERGYREWLDEYPSVQRFGG